MRYPSVRRYNTCITRALLGTVPGHGENVSEGRLTRPPTAPVHVYVHCTLWYIQSQFQHRTSAPPTGPHPPSSFMAGKSLLELSRCAPVKRYLRVCLSSLTGFKSAVPPPGRGGWKGGHPIPWHFKPIPPPPFPGGVVFCRVPRVPCRGARAGIDCETIAMSRFTALYRTESRQNVRAESDGNASKVHTAQQGCTTGTNARNNFGGGWRKDIIFCWMQINGLLNFNILYCILLK